MSSIQKRLPTGIKVAEKFQILELIGFGGMGEVYKASNINTGQIVALKVIQAREAAGDSHATDRFKREIKALEKLRNDHIVRYVESGPDSHTQGHETTEFEWLAMEFLKGQTLLEMREAKAPCSPSLVLEIMRQICVGLTEAHKNDVVHRDLKPANIMVEHSADLAPHLKIIDWGLAYLLDHVPDRTTRGGVGTYAYMAYEQSMGQKLDKKVDIWPLGLIAFELLTGKYFWDKPPQVYFREPAKPIPLPSARVAALNVDVQLPRGFDDWFARCVVYNPEKRFENAHDAYRALEAVLDPMRAKIATLNDQIEQLKSAIKSTHDDLGKIEGKILVRITNQRDSINREHEDSKVNLVDLISKNETSRHEAEVQFREDIKGNLRKLVHEVETLTLHKADASKKIDKLEKAMLLLGAFVVVGGIYFVAESGPRNEPPAPLDGNGGIIKPANQLSNAKEPTSAQPVASRDKPTPATSTIPSQK